MLGCLLLADLPQACGDDCHPVTGVAASAFGDWIGVIAETGVFVFAD
jgi:hypothetical protein